MVIIEYQSDPFLHGSILIKTWVERYKEGQEEFIAEMQPTSTYLEVSSLPPAYSHEPSSPDDLLEPMETQFEAASSLDEQKIEGESVFEQEELEKLRQQIEELKAKNSNKKDFQLSTDMVLVITGIVIFFFALLVVILFVVLRNNIKLKEEMAEEYAKDRLEIQLKLRKGRLGGSSTPVMIHPQAHEVSGFDNLEESQCKIKLPVC